MRKLLLLSHDGSWERLYQMASCAASAGAQGVDVDIVFFFGALKKLAEGRLDEHDDARHEAAAMAVGTRSVSSILSDARQTGHVRFFACSASQALEELDPELVSPRVDEILGWPSVIRLMGEAERVLYL